MDNIQKALRLAMEQYKKENGEDAKLEDGEEFATVFNDGVLILGIENHELKVKVLLGEPYKIDFSFEMTERTKCHG